jgi:AMIN domain
VKYSLPSLLALALLVPSSAQAAESSRLPSVDKVSVVAESPFQLRIETSAQIAPQAQMIEQPERLVIDLPNTRPGTALHRLNVNRGAVKSVRASLYSTQPPMTRIVVDLMLPQWYRIVPDKSGVLVTIGGGEGAPTDPGTTVGWVSTKSTPARPGSAKTSQSVRVAAVAARQQIPINGVSVEFTDGQLTVHANNATLSEVLFQIQKKTGAEIAIPSGTEQDRVAADFGPGTPSEVLSQLLNGSGLNFVVVGSETNPKILRSVLLTRMDPEMPSAVQPYSPPLAENMQMEAPDQPMVAPGPEMMQQQGMPEIDNPPLQNTPDVAPQQPQPDPPNNN